MCSTIRVSIDDLKKSCPCLARAPGSFSSEPVDHAFPADEIKPLSCSAVGHDYTNLENSEVNDVMGDYSLTLVDSLDAFVVFNDTAGFEHGLKETIKHVSFDRNARVQVFEVTIRMLGGLLSAHTYAADRSSGFYVPWYENELLSLADDLGRRLLPAFDTPTGLPYARVNLRHGVRRHESLETCTAAAGSLLLEFATLSALTQKPIYKNVATLAFNAVWDRRSKLDLVGNTLNVHTGNWIHAVSSTGAGIDSFLEYAAKAYVMFNDRSFLDVWTAAYRAVKQHIRAPDAFWYRGVHMYTGQLASVHVDSLSAFLPGVQVLMGDIEGAIKSHLTYAFQWKRFHALPELFDIQNRAAIHLGYPLRPEFIESNMYLYRATHDDFYLEMAAEILQDIRNRTMTECGLAAIYDISTGELEDKQPSFVTSETLKYLYLTFDEHNPLHTAHDNSVYSTEGHMLRLPCSRISQAPRRRHANTAAGTIAPKTAAYSKQNSLSREIPTSKGRTKKLFTSTTGRESTKARMRRLKHRAGKVPSHHPLSSNTTQFSTAVLESNDQCQIYDPYTNPATQHFLLPSVKHRRDYEYARNLVGFQLEKSADWFSYAQCDTGPSDEHTVEIVFAPSTELEDSHPGRHKVDVVDGTVTVFSLAGLRMSLTRLQPSFEQYIITRVGSHDVPKGHVVRMKDPKVVSTIPSLFDEEMTVARLDIEMHPRVKRSDSDDTREYTPEKDAPRLRLACVQASFGESLVEMFRGQKPELEVLPPDRTGCSLRDYQKADVKNKIVVVQRGRCTFAAKSQTAVEAGASGVIVINNVEEGDVIPAAEPFELDRPVAPLAMVSKNAGKALFNLRKGTPSSDLLRVAIFDVIDEPYPIVVSGYAVDNLVIPRHR